jgi:hypothetical protein
VAAHSGHCIFNYATSMQRDDINKTDAVEPKFIMGLVIFVEFSTPQK